MDEDDPDIAGSPELDLLDDVSQEQSMQGPGKDLEVEFIHQRIVFVIPALPPRRGIQEKRKRVSNRERREQLEDQQQQQQQQQREEEDQHHRQRKKKKRKKRKKAAIDSSIGRVAVLRFPGSSSEDRIRAAFLRKRVERRGGLRLWLGSKGLGRFARLFQEHRIEVGELSRLTMDALKEIGVLPVGPRRKLISAIQKLCI